MWKFLYKRLNPNHVTLQPGYSLLLPVPGDLPVFLKIALEGCNAQNSEGLVETLILPDRPSRQLESLLHIWAKRYSVSALRLLNPHPLEPVLAGMHSISLIDLQLMRGVREAQASHALIQSVGDFVVAPDFRRSQYQRAIEPPLQEPQTAHDKHRSRAAESALYPVVDVRQTSRLPLSHAITSAIAGNGAANPSPSAIVQFPGLLPAYRRYQRRNGAFEDSEFHLLLMRLLVDAYDQSGRSYQLPLIDDLTRGIADPTAQITYSDAQTRQRYPNFRHKFDQILQSGLIDPIKVAIMQDELSLFERVWGER